MARVRVPRVESKLEADFAWALRAMGVLGAVREMHPYWCCEHLKRDHDAPPRRPHCVTCCRGVPVDVTTHPVCEHPYWRERDWRIDFAWPDRRLAVELQGGVWSGGRHTRGAGYIADDEKSNRLTEDGWRVLRFTREEVDSNQAVDQVKRILEGGL